MTDPIDTSPLPGTVWGMLTELRFSERRNYKDYFLYRCECGVEKEIVVLGVRRGITRSCGCLIGRSSARRMRTHGHTTGPTDSAEYRAWKNMRQRCHNPNDISYRNYGACGVRVCDEWRDNFCAFLEHVGPRPSQKHSLDRLDNSLGYQPGNVRWATRGEQNRNTSRNVMITFRGKTQCAMDWASDLGLSFKSIKQRLERWPLERALTTPPIATARRR